MAGGRCPVAGVAGGRCPCPAAAVRCPVAGVREPVGLRCLVFGGVCGGRWPVSGGRCPVSGVRCAVSGGRWPVANAYYKYEYCGLGTCSLVIEPTTSTNIVVSAHVPWSSNLNIFTVWAWMLSGMLWSCDAIEYERYCGLGMDTLVIGRSLR